MSPPASSSDRKEKSSSVRAHRVKTGASFVFAIAVLFGMVWTEGDESYAGSMTLPIAPEVESEVVVVSLGNVGAPATRIDEAAPPHGIQSERADICQFANTTTLARLDLPAAVSELMPDPVVPPIRSDVLQTMGSALVGAWGNGVYLAAFGQKEAVPKFAATYRSVLNLVAITELPRIQNDASLMHTPRHCKK